MAARTYGMAHSDNDQAVLLDEQPTQAVPGLVDDIDAEGAGGFLAAHHVPIISPDIGIELIKVVKRLEVVQQVYPLPPTVEVYRLALHLVLQVAAEHQRAFCAKLEEALGDRKSTRLNSSHLGISYAGFCLKKKRKSTRLNSSHSGNSYAGLGQTQMANQ